MLEQSVVIFFNDFAEFLKANDHPTGAEFGTYDQGQLALLIAYWIQKHSEQHTGINGKFFTDDPLDHCNIEDENAARQAQSAAHNDLVKKFVELSKAEDSAYLHSALMVLEEHYLSLWH